MKFDGFVKSPTSALRGILRFFKVRKVRIITQDLRALNLELFSLPSKSVKRQLFLSPTTIKIEVSP